MATGTRNHQKIAVGNVNLFLTVSHLKKKDLAEHMSKKPAVMPRMLKNEQVWYFDDMCNAADFLGVSLETLQRKDLTVSEAQSIWDNIKAKRADNQNGGLPVVNIDDSRRRSGVWIWRALNVILAA